jgi:hypothetical protein
MNSFRSENESVQSTYMSQAEANEVMELWERRQREDAARQALVTIHDVAEATQLSPQEIQALLRDVRSTKTIHAIDQPLTCLVSEIQFWPAVLKLLPYTVIPAFLAILFCVLERNPFSVVGHIVLVCGLWILGITVGYAAFGCYRLSNDAQKGRAMRQKSMDDLRMNRP